MMAQANPRDAAAMLEHVDGVKARTRRDVQSFWFPLSLFGGLSLLGLPFSGVEAAIFWALAAPAGFVAIAVHYARRERRIGAGAPARPYVVVSLAMTAGAFLLPALAPERWKGVSWAFAIAAGYIAFGLIDRSRLLTGLGLLMAVVPLIAVAMGLEHRDTVVGAVIGAALLVSGLVVRRWDVDRLPA